MTRWNIYWAPEGRKIATEEAKTPHEAIGKAPLPYRKYRGELYAVPEVVDLELAANNWKNVKSGHSCAIPGCSGNHKAHI